MNLMYKPDWEQTKENYKAWWAHEYFGRCAISVKAPKEVKTPEEPPVQPEKPEDMCFDLEFIAAVNDYRMRNTFYGGEAFPSWSEVIPGGSGTHATYLGAPVTVDARSIWVEPIINEEDLTDYDFRNLKIDRNGSLWKYGCDLRRLAVRESLGKSIPSNNGVGACGDTLAFLRSTDKLLIDIIECPDYVKEFELYLMKQWTEIYDDFYKITSNAAEGSTCWFELWSPGKFYAAQCDFAYMISPRTFNDIFLPSIKMQTEYLDNTVYHLDGEGNFAHIDALLELPRLQSIQVLPGAGKPSPLHYMDILKKVQAKGKNLHITITQGEVEAALSELSARGLFIVTNSNTEREARELLTCCEKWSRD